MNQSDQSASEPAGGSHLLRNLRLYRAWRRSIVGTVDHQRVAEKIAEDTGWSPRYAFMIMMSAGIAVLGLLLSSPAVVIGAMLISPLMSPVLGLGFSLALFDFAETRRALTALAIGSVVAVLFTAVIVLASPLKAPTAEILARTRPNLFDLLVALFAALAGTFALIRGRGETVVGVAIATASMPPLAVIGYGLATWNLPVLVGALALFVTNCVTIALAATVTARFYGFGRFLSPEQSRKQTILLAVVFGLMAVPLGISLRRIAAEALMIKQVRSFLSDRFGADSRVNQLDIDFDQQPIVIRAVVIAARAKAASTEMVTAELGQRLERPVALELKQLLLDGGPRSIETQRAELRQTADAEAVAARAEADRKVVNLVAVTAAVRPEDILLDHERKKVVAKAVALPGASLETYRALEQRAEALTDGWEISIAPPLGVLPFIRFGDGVDTLDVAAREAVTLSVWAARRWNVPALGVPGLPPTDSMPPRLLLSHRRALAIARILQEQDILTLHAPAAGREFRLLVAQPASVR